MTAFSGARRTCQLAESISIPEQGGTRHLSSGYAPAGIPDMPPSVGLPECRLELNCCRGQVVIPVRLLIRQHGDPTFATILARLRCQRCKASPAPVFLCAGGREHTGGAPPDWAIELIPRLR
jgi:hypothetical protein